MNPRTEPQDETVVFPDSIAEAIRSLLKNPDFRSREQILRVQVGFRRCIVLPCIVSRKKSRILKRLLAGQRQKSLVSSIARFRGRHADGVLYYYNDCIRHTTSSFSDLGFSCTHLLDLYAPLLRSFGYSCCYSEGRHSEASFLITLFESSLHTPTSTDGFLREDVPSLLFHSLY